MHARTQRPARRDRRRGFTIVEVLIVLVIIGLIGGIVALNFVGAADKARVDTTKTSMDSIRSAMSLYRGTYGVYPADMQQLINENLIQANKARDAWGRGFQIFPSETEAYELVSYGADGVAGGEGTDADIVFTPSFP